MVTTKPSQNLSVPALQIKADILREYLAGLSVSQLQTTMHISKTLADKVHSIYASETELSAAAEVFRGDIYSGLRATDFTQSERDFAQQHLAILSGLYGVLRPYDGIAPYRLEAAYKFPKKQFNSIYDYWGGSIANEFDNVNLLINCTSIEYEKLLMPHLGDVRIIKPKFLSVLNDSSKPKFVAVHAKIARGAYARWIIRSQLPEMPDVANFSDLGYVFDEASSTYNEPVYIAKEFQGIGLSQRLA